LSDAKDWIGGANKNSDEEQYVITLTDGTLIGACGIEVRDEAPALGYWLGQPFRSEEHTSELQSLTNLVCRLLLEKKKKTANHREHGDKAHLPQTNQDQKNRQCRMKDRDQRTDQLLTLLVDCRPLDPRNLVTLRPC